AGGWRPRGSSGEETVPKHDQHDQGQDDQHERQDDRGAGIGLARLVDGQGKRLGPTGEVPGEGDGRAELPERTSPRQGRSRGELGCDEGQRDASEDVGARPSERRCRVLQPAVDRAEAGLRGDHEEGHRHERRRHDRARCGERQPDPHVIEQPPHETGPAECSEQADPPDDGRKDDRDARPPEPLTYPMNRRARSTSELPSTAAIGYVATTFTSAGIGTAETRPVATPFTSDAYTMAASASPAMTFATSDASSGSFETTFCSAGPAIPALSSAWR